MNTFEDLIADTAAYLGFETLEPDENGICEFISEEAQILVMGCPEVEDTVLVTAKVAEQVESNNLFLALKANHRFLETKGATLSIDAEDGALVLSVYRPLCTLNGQKMAELLETFMTALLSLRETLG